MENQTARLPLAEDAKFLASLSDLDSGLEAPHDEPAPVIRRGMPLSPPAKTRPGTRARTIDLSSLPPIVQVPGSRRRLLDLFPAPPEIQTTPDAPATVPPGDSVPDLLEPPFSLSTDPKFLYRSAAHDEVAQQVLTAIRQHDGMVLVTGAFGTGKTTLCRVVADVLDHRTLVSVVLDPVASIEDLLRTILVDFGVASRADLARAPHAATRAGMIATLRTFLSSLSSLDALAVLIIDEAQQLPIGVLEDLPVVAQAGESGRALQVILVGDPTLTTIVKRSELRLLQEEIAVRPLLRPLAADEIAGYVRYRLSVAAPITRVEFDERALARLYEISSGVPRVVNQLCERAMSIGARQSADVIDEALIDAAGHELGLHPPVAERSRALHTGLIAAALVAMMTLGAGGALWVFRADVATALVRWENIPAAPHAPALPAPDPLGPGVPPVNKY